MVIEHEHLTNIKVTPKISKSEIHKLRPDFKHPNQGVNFPKGKHTIVVKISKGTKLGKPNRITEAGLVLPTVHSEDKVSKYFKSVTVTIVKVKHTTDDRRVTVKKSVHVPTTKRTVGDLRNLLRRPHHYVKRVVVTFTVEKVVPVKLHVRGCVDQVKPRPTTTTQVPTTFKPIFPSSCSHFNLVENVNFTEFFFTPNITACEEKKLRSGLKNISEGVHLTCGTHSIVVVLKDSNYTTTYNELSSIGFVVTDKSENDRIDKYFDYFYVIVERHDIPILRDEFALQSSVIVPGNYLIKNLFRLMGNSLRNVKTLTFHLKLKEMIIMKLNIVGCIKAFISSLTPPFGTTTIPMPLINEQIYQCSPLNNLFDALPGLRIKVIPTLDDSKLNSLKSVSTMGASLQIGEYRMDFVLTDQQTVNIIEFGVVLFIEDQSKTTSDIIQITRVTATRLITRYGKLVSMDRTLTVGDSLAVKDLRNVLSAGLTSINKISLKFQLLKPVKASINLKGCKQLTPVIGLSTTPVLGPTTVPMPLINEQSYQCSPLNNLFDALPGLRINVIPTLDDSKLNNLKSMGTKGASLQIGEYGMDFVLKDQQTVNVIEFGVVLFSKDQSKKTSDIIQLTSVTATRLVKRFGKITALDMSIAIGDSLAVKDLRNILSAGLTSINKISLKFQLLKPVKASINLKGCKQLTPVVNRSTTLSPQINHENYNCDKNVNILGYSKVVKLIKVPPLSVTDDVKLRSPSVSTETAAPINVGKHKISISLPSGEKATVTKLGLNFVGENNATVVKSFITNLKVIAIRLRMNFGQMIPLPMKISIPDDIHVQELVNLLKRQLTNINKVEIKFEAKKKSFLNIIMTGCISRSVLKATTLAPVGCLHLNAYYPHGDLIVGNSQCDVKICSDGGMVSVFQCNEKWTSWTKCSKPCGAGQMSKRQICVFNKKMRSVNTSDLVKRINETCFNRAEIKPCFDQPCQESCKLTQWSQWAPCDNSTCKDEYQTRLRQLVSDNKNLPCTKPLMESRRCLKPQCSCIENAELNSCANIMCPTSCDHLNGRVKCVSKDKNCIKACVCKIGYLYQNGVCVPRSNCQCLKPDFNSLILSPTSTGFNKDLKTTTSSGVIGNTDALQNKESGITTAEKIVSTTKPVKFEFSSLSTKDYQRHSRHQTPKTPPWAPGVTNPPFYQASPLWYPGTTPYGATIAFKKVSKPKKIITPPPMGFKQKPPETRDKDSAKLRFFVTKRYVPRSSSPATTTVSNLPPGSINNPSSQTTVELASSATTSNMNQPISQSPPSGVSVSGGSSPTSSDSSVNSGTQFPNQGQTPVELQTRLVSNSTIIVDCRSCVCTDGKLVCSGPRCSVGSNNWSDWSMWSPCTAVCGVGFKRRFRQCQGAMCEDKSSPQPGIRRLMATDGVQSEDKTCFVTQCSCIYSRELLKIHIGEEQINKYGIDLAAVWIEKDNIKGLTNSKEIVKSGDIIRSGTTLFTKCSQCVCTNGQFNCNIDCH